MQIEITPDEALQGAPPYTLWVRNLTLTDKEREQGDRYGYEILCDGLRTPAFGLEISDDALLAALRTPDGLYAMFPDRHAVANFRNVVQMGMEWQLEIWARAEAEGRATWNG